MTVTELIAKYNGKPCKTLPATINGSQTPQCYDLALAWTDGLGVPHYPGNPSPFPYANASQIYTDFSSNEPEYRTVAFIKFEREATGGSFIFNLI